MAFPILTVFLIFIVVLNVLLKSSKNKSRDMSASFWEREAAANAAPTANLDDLTYITIPLDKFPLGFTQDEEVVAIENSLSDLSTHRLLNLTGKTNTELKETYGVANLAAMQEIGEDFDKLTLLLKDYGSALMDREMITEAVSVLEFGAAIKTDISQNYTMLGQCYLKQGKPDKINYLIEQVEQMNLVLGPSIIRHLQDLLPPEVSDQES